VQESLSVKYEIGHSTHEDEITNLCRKFGHQLSKDFLPYTRRAKTVTYTTVKAQKIATVHQASCNCRNSTTNLTFRGLCVVIYSYNKRQQDAPFLKFI
jgi:hypothetical protein